MNKINDFMGVSMVMARINRTESWIGSYTVLLNKKDEKIKELELRIEKYIEQTRLIDEHNEDFNEACECKLCQSYMVADC